MPCPKARACVVLICATGLSRRLLAGLTAGITAAGAQTTRILQQDGEMPVLGLTAIRSDLPLNSLPLIHMLLLSVPQAAV